MPNVSTSLLRQFARTDRFRRGVPELFTITEDGTTVLFLRGRAGDDPVTCLWALDVATGTERVLADPAQLLDTPEAIAGYATDAIGRRAAFVLAGALWTVEVTDARPRQLSIAGHATDPRFDPSGTRIAYRDGDELRVVDIDESDSGADRALATPDGPEVSFGVGRYANLAGIDHTSRGLAWAPDGQRLLVTRSDLAAVPLWYLSDPSRPTQPPRTVRYPSVGQRNPDVTLWLIGLDGTRTQVCWDRLAFEYLVGASWDAVGPYAVVQTRDQRTVRFLDIDPTTGQTSVLHEQHDEPWVELVPGVPARTGSGVLVTHQDTGDTRHLAVAGAAVTPPGLQLRAVLDVDGEDVLFTASDEPTTTHLYRYHPDTGVRRLTEDTAVHDGLRRAGTLVRIALGQDRPGGHVTVLREGSEPVPVTSFVDTPVLAPNVRHLVLGPRALRARLHLPSWHTPDHRRLPILLDPYGGAAKQCVTAELHPVDLTSQWFAEQGFAVLVADGAGTPGRGPAWDHEVFGDIFGPVLADQITALQETVKLFPELDPGRVGIRGWSFGGSLTEFAILTRPDVFHAAAAGAGVTDQLLYDTHWRERFLGHPDTYPEAYERCSLVRLAPGLSRPLLLIHGLDDDNVHPSNTLLLSQALLAAGRPHELLLLPGVGHQAFTSAFAEQLLLRQLDFFRRHL